MKGWAIKGAISGRNQPFIPSLTQSPGPSMAADGATNPAVCFVLLEVGHTHR